MVRTTGWGELQDGSGVAQNPSWDDVLLLPELRTLTCVKGLEWPPVLWAYVQELMVKRGNVATYELDQH